MYNVSSGANPDLGKRGDGGVHNAERVKLSSIKYKVY